MEASKVINSINQMGVSQYILVVLLMVGAFMLGSLYTKVQYLEKGNVVKGDAAAAAPGVKSKYRSFEEAMKAIAKEIKIDDRKLVECMNKGDKKTIVESDLAQGNKLGVNGTPTFFLNGRLISGALPFEEFKKIIDEELSGKAEAAATRVSVTVDNAPVQGKTGAALTLVGFSDFQCSYCARVPSTIGEILKEYEGKIVFAYKYFPLTNMHPRAQKAAEAAECAKDQGKFWEFHDKLFENQNDWAAL